MLRDPVVIIGSGGSGTRVPTVVLEKAGVFPGQILDKDSRDSVPFHRLVRWAIEEIRRSGKLDRAEFRETAQEYARIHLGGKISEEIEGGEKIQWMIKCPKLILVTGLLPFAFPDMKLIHVVRDGRDMAFTKNEVPFRLMNPDQEPTPLGMAAFWQRWNMYAADRREQMPCRSITARLEDLVEKPTEETQRICDFVGVDKPVGAELLIDRPQSLGRWHGQDGVDGIEESCRVGLQHFGYEPVRARDGDAP